MSSVFPGIPDDERSFKSKYRAFEKDPNHPMLDEQVIRLAGIPIKEITDDFFLIKFKDPYAKKALLAYADSCEKDNPKLAADLRRKLDPNHVDRLRRRLVAKADDHPMMRKDD